MYVSRSVWANQSKSVEPVAFDGDNSSASSSAAFHFWKSNQCNNKTSSIAANLRFSRQARSTNNKCTVCCVHSDSNFSPGLRWLSLPHIKHECVNFDCCARRELRFSAWLHTIWNLKGRQPAIGKIFTSIYIAIHRNIDSWISRDFIRLWQMYLCRIRTITVKSCLV